jgi:hypothetical protein
MIPMSDVFRKSVVIAALAIGAALVVAAHSSLAHSSLTKPLAIEMPQGFSRG